MRISDWSSDVCSSDLLVRYFRNALQRRRRGRVIRLKLERGMPSDLTALLLDSLPQGAAIITEVDGIIGLGDVSQLVDCARPDLQFLPYTPRFPELILEPDMSASRLLLQQDVCT